MTAGYSLTPLAEGDLDDTWDYVTGRFDIADGVLDSLHKAIGILEIVLTVHLVQAIRLRGHSTGPPSPLGRCFVRYLRFAASSARCLHFLYVTGSHSHHGIQLGFESDAPQYTSSRSPKLYSFVTAPLSIWP